MNYIKLKEKIELAEADHGIGQLDQISKELLQRVALASSYNKEISAVSLMQSAPELIRPLIYGRIRRLIDDGWIERVGAKKDSRMICLQITERSKKIFLQISEQLKKQKSNFSN